MSRAAQKAYASLFGVVGLAVLLVGLFTAAYDFMLGLVIAIVIWAGGGILGKYWKDKNREAKP